MTVARLIGPWTLDPIVSAGCVVAAAVYLLAVRARPGWSTRATVAWTSGLAVVAVALQSGVDANADRLLSAHMVEHLLLLDLAAPLLLLGEPVRLLLLSLRSPHRARTGRALTRLARRLSPALCLAIYTVVVLGVHLPGLFAVALAHRLAHAAMHGLFLVAGLLVWWPVLGRPNPRRLGPIGHLLYLTVAMLPMVVFGAFLNRDTTVLYAHYAATGHGLGVSALDDQAQAGAIMWVVSTVAMAGLGLAAVMVALVSAERRQRARELHGVAP